MRFQLSSMWPPHCQPLPSLPSSLLPCRKIRGGQGRNESEGNMWEGKRWWSSQQDAGRSCATSKHQCSKSSVLQHHAAPQRRQVWLGEQGNGHTGCLWNLPVESCSASAVCPARKLQAVSRQGHGGTCAGGCPGCSAPSCGSGQIRPQTGEHPSPKAMGKPTRATPQNSPAQSFCWKRDFCHFSRERGQTNPSGAEQEVQHQRPHHGIGWPCCLHTQLSHGQPTVPRFAPGATAAVAGRHQPCGARGTGMAPRSGVSRNGWGVTATSGGSPRRAGGNSAAAIPQGLRLPGDIQENEIIFTKFRTESCLDKSCLGLRCKLKCR